MKWRTFALAAVALLLASPGVARHAADGQGQSHKWWLSDKYKSELGLTAQQSGQIEDIFQATLPKLRSGWRELDRLEGELSKLIAESRVDESQVAQMVDRVEAARAELGKTRTLMLYRMNRVLSPEQRVKLKALHEQWERDRRRPTDKRL